MIMVEDDYFIESPQSVDFDEQQMMLVTEANEDEGDSPRQRTTVAKKN